jgi:MOSC domain-containing protein YiiM
MQSNIISIATGESQSYKDKNGNIFHSSYKKDNFFDKVAVDKLGIKGDTQTDKRYHGGEDKSILFSSSLHFDRFEKMYSKEVDKLFIGANILIDQYDESDINIGDVFEIGNVVLEVTQPRQPCWKIAVIFDKYANRYIVQNFANGWYVRVLEDGIIDKSNKMVLKNRVTDISIKDLTTYLRTPPTDKELIEKILQMPFLADAYKRNFKEVL